MAAMDFPNSPAVNDEFTVGQRTWIWNGTTWDAKSTNLPTHASTHASAGSDPVTIAQSQVTDLTTALSGKANLSGATFTGTVTGPTIFASGAAGAGNITNRIGSGAFENSAPTVATGWPVTGSWYHLNSTTHSNLANYYAMQFAGDFFNSNNIFYRATNGGGTTGWNRLLHTGNANTIRDTGVSLSTAASDAYTTIRSTGSAITITVTNTLAVGQRIDFIQSGTGQITFSPSGITLNSKSNNRKTAAQHSGATVVCVAAGVYTLIGDLVA
jgi:hypothetical protein